MRKRQKPPQTILDAVLLLENFTEAGTLYTDVDPTYPKIMFRSYFMPLNATARYLRIKAKANPRPGAWLFVDEIAIN